jgi:23S rRNA (guanosine2251-2'-O)-methyltransferase
VVYGRNPVRELIAAGRRRVHEVWAVPSVAGEEWLAGVPVRERSRDDIGRLAGSADHQGVVAVADPYPYADARELIAAAGPLVALDGAHDPRNIGAIARVADAVGAAGLAIPRRGGPGVTPTVVKASAGAAEHLRVARVDNVASLVHDARMAGRPVVGADADAAKDYRRIAWAADAVLVMGAEGAGLRPRVRAVCDVLVRLPMRGHVASLNIAVAAGVLLYEAVRNTD